MTQSAQPAEPRDITWEEAVTAIGVEVWKLAPQDHQDAGHRDITFLTNWQDIMYAVEQGILSAAVLPDKGQT